MSSLHVSRRTNVARVLFLLLAMAATARAMAAAGAPLQHHRGEPRAWALLEQAAAWGDSLRTPNARYWLEYDTQLPCGSPGEGLRGVHVRLAQADGGRLSMEVRLNPGPAGALIRCDGRRYMEHSLSGGTWRVVDGPMPAVKTGLAGAEAGFFARMATGLVARDEVDHDTTRVARCMGPDSFFVDGRTRRCERVRIEADPRGPQAHAEDLWIDRESGCVWLSASVDSAGELDVRRPRARYWFLHAGEAPPDSLFDTRVPAGARIVTDMESTRPRPRVDPVRAPRIAADGTVTFRWKGEARGVALVGSFNCWDPRTDPMSRGADGMWTCTHTVDMRGVNDYLFLVDGTRWITDPLNPGGRGDGFGGWVSCLPAPPPGIAR